MNILKKAEKETREELVILKKNPGHWNFFLSARVILALLRIEKLLLLLLFLWNICGNIVGKT